MHLVCQGTGVIPTSWHLCKIKEAQSIAYRRYCLPFTEEVNNCQTVDAHEGLLKDGMNLMQQHLNNFAR